MPKLRQILVLVLFMGLAACSGTRFENLGPPEGGVKSGSGGGGPKQPGRI